MKGLIPPITVTLVAAASMSLEIIAGRALAPYVGMSLYSWTVIIAVVLAGLSIGHWLGGVISDRSINPSIWVAYSLVAAAVSTVFSLTAMKLIAPYAAGSNPISHVGFLALGAFFLPSTLAGIVSPLLTKIAIDIGVVERQGRIIGMMYALGAFGAIIGTLLTGLILISWVGTSRSIFIIAILYSLLSIPFWQVTYRYLAVVIMLICIGITVQFSENFNLGAACFEESSYFCIRVDNTIFLGRSARIMALDHLAHGINDKNDPSLLLSPYIQGIDEIVRARFTAPSLNAFFVGGGAYTLPRAWLSTYAKADLLVAELDPTVTSIARQKFWLPETQRLKIEHGDARYILSSLAKEKKFDVIFGDAFHDISIPQHLVTDEFHQIVSGHLSPNGIYAINVVDRFEKPFFLLSLVKTLKLQFPVVEVWLDFDSIPREDARVTWIVIASNKAANAGTFKAVYGFQRQWARAPIDTMNEIVGLNKLVTLTDDFAPVSRLLSGVLLNQKMVE